MTIRRMAIEDYESVYNLWINTTNKGLNDVDDSKLGIERMLKRNPTLNFIAEDKNQRIVGVIMAGEDGRRGYIYHTTVHSDYRNQGIGQNLLQHTLKELKKLSISKVGLLIFKGNKIGNEFWERQGFNIREDIYYRNRALIELERMDT